MKHSLIFGLLFCVLIGCEKAPPTTVNSETTSTLISTKSPTLPIPAQIQETFNIKEGVFLKGISTSTELNMRVGEELMLLGEVSFSDGKTLSFDQLKNILNVENKTPNLLSLDLNTRLVKALQSGSAKVLVTLKQSPLIQQEVIILIQKPLVAPDQAILNLEIE